ncbi:hypothetical protein JCM16303_005780 [Sporobolomyces ruberrimus]
MSSPQVESPAGDSLSHNDLIAEVEKTARSQVDEERKSAVQHLHQLLKEIADQAIANGDDEGVLELWQAKWMENFKDNTWVDDVKRSMISYFLRSNDKVVSGMQILLSVRAVHGRAEPYLTPCYGSEQILERVEAWNVNPSNSLSKRLIGRRIAEIEGVAHFKNANGETCF